MLYFCLHLASVNHGMATCINKRVTAPPLRVLPQPVAMEERPAYDDESDGIHAGIM